MARFSPIGAVSIALALMIGGHSAPAFVGRPAESHSGLSELPVLDASGQEHLPRQVILPV